MAESWHKLGVIVPEKTSEKLQKLGYSEYAYVETQRSHPYGDPNRKSLKDYTKTFLKTAEKIRIV